MGSIGTSAFAIFLATALMYYFTTSFHPFVVFWLMVSSAILCAVCVIAWFYLAQSSREEPKALQSINTDGGDNSGAQMIAGRDIHYHPPAAPALVEPLGPAPPPTAEEPPVHTRTGAAPTLRINRRTEEVIFDYMQRGWRLAHHGEPASQTALVLWIENVFPTQGNARNLSNLIASIRAEQFESITIPRAYWIQQRDNEVNLASGSRLGVLVGHFSRRDSFVSYSNPHAPTSYQYITDDGFRPLGERLTLPLVLRDGDTASLRIVVTVAQMPYQTVIACRQIIITLPQLTVDMRECEPN